MTVGRRVVGIAIVPAAVLAAILVTMPRGAVGQEAVRVARIGLGLTIPQSILVRADKVIEP